MNKLLSILLMISNLAINLMAQDAPDFKIIRESLLNFDMKLQPVSGVQSGPYRQPSGKIWRHVLAHPDRVTAIRIHFVVNTAANHQNWRIVIKDFATAVIETIPAFENEIWTDEIPGAGAIVELWSDQDPGNLQISVDQYAYRTVKAFPQGITGTDDRWPISSASQQMKLWGRAVAKLRFIVANQGQGTCTAFLITKDLLMTNEHCIQTEAEMRSAIAEFEYDSFGSHPVRVRASKLELVDPVLDFSILRLREDLSRYGPLKLNPLNLLAEPKNFVIIQHPAGEPKQVSVEGCFLNAPQRTGVGDTLTDFGHACDTLGGSSGSPVLDSNDGRVLGLHHLGYDPTATELINQAVYLSQILNLIRTSKPGLYQEIQAANE